MSTLDDDDCDVDVRSGRFKVIEKQSFMRCLMTRVSNEIADGYCELDDVLFFLLFQAIKNKFHCLNLV